LSFDGQYSKIGDFELKLNEEMIVKASNFPLKGECRSNTKRVKDIPWSETLSSSKCKYDYKGVHLSLVKEKWHFLLGIIKGYITCEGRYSLYFIYHFLLLMVSMGYKLNMPLFLLKGISKMVHF
jgi:hypothetical protein